MTLYTVCIKNRPVVVMSASAEAPMEEWVLNDPELLKAVRFDQSIRNRVKARIPNFDSVEELDEINKGLDTWLGEDLRTLENNGIPLWSGDRTDVDIREANTDELERWHTSHHEALISGEADVGENSWLIFLVPVTDPADDEDL